MILKPAEDGGGKYQVVLMKKEMGPKVWVQREQWG